MASENELELEEALDKWLRSYLRGFLVVDGVIDAVNDDFTCDVMVGTTVFNSVPVDVLIGTQSDFFAKPALNSKCLVGFRDGNINRPQIIKCNNIELFTFNQGELGGMVKVIDLVTKMNKLEEDLNNLKAAFNAWVPVPNDGGAALKAAAAAWAGQEITLTVRADLEDTSVTH